MSCKYTVCRACGKLGHYKHYRITTCRQRMPRPHSKQRVSSNSRSKSLAAPRSVHEVTDQSQNQSADGVYIDNVCRYILRLRRPSRGPKRCTSTLQRSSASLDSGAEANCMPYSTLLSLRYLSNIRQTSELLAGYTAAPPARHVVLQR